jgi:hypothetical protein
MLLHIRQQLFSEYRNVSLIDLKIEPFGLHLVGGRDLKVGRPYPNKQYAVACRKQGHKALDGILLETKSFVKEMSTTARWAIEAELCVTHSVDYKILDQEFDAASDHMVLWIACCKEFGGWSNRYPQGMQDMVPMVTEPMMEIDPGAFDDRRKCEDIIDKSDNIVSRHEVFSMPTIEPERLLDTRLYERIPGREMAFRL